jgi:hypothetical protein
MLKRQINPEGLLYWTINRLKYKHKEDQKILLELSRVLENYKLFPRKLPLEFIDSICKKHYPDFDLEKTPDMNIGYTDKERMQIRNLIVEIIKDISQQ